jgi:hypothetical protein
MLRWQRVLGNQNIDRLLRSKHDGVDDERGADNRELDAAKKSPSFETVAGVLNSPGMALDTSTRRLMEARFGHGFGDVAVHTDARAASSARAIGASAYTVGRHLVFAAGRYAPNTSEGRRLLAHELTHTIQQVGAVPGSLAVSHPTDRGEREADHAASAVASGQRFSPVTRHAPLVARDVPIPEDLRGEEREQAERALLERRFRQQGRQPPAEPAPPGDEGPGTILGGLMGEFNEDPTLAMIGVDTAVSLVPVLDQASDVRDVLAHLYYMVAREQYTRFMRWVGLIFTLIGLFPELGSAIKGASKFILKGVREVIEHLTDILRPIRALMPAIADIGRFQGFVNRQWGRIINAGLTYWARAVSRVDTIVGAVTHVARAFGDRLARGLRRVRELAPRMLRVAFEWVRDQFNRVLDAVRARLGLQTTRVERDVDEAVERAFTEHVGAAPTQPYSTTQRLVRGNLGERRAAEALAADGHHILSYKPSILGTNQGGIDIVTMRNGVVHLIDNKALTRSGNVGSVSALTDNFAQNLAAVRAELTRTLANAGSPGERQLLQQALNALNSNNFVRAVTNANVTPDNRILRGVTQQLQRQDIQFIDLMR